MGFAQRIHLSPQEKVDIKVVNDEHLLFLCHKSQEILKHFFDFFNFSF